MLKINTIYPIKEKVVHTDGSPITTGVAVYHITGITRVAGTGTLTHIANGVWNYTPVLAETNYAEYSIEFQHLDAVGGGPIVQIFTDTSISSDLAATLATKASQTSVDSKASQASVDSKASQVSVDATATQVSVNALNNVSAAEVKTQVVAALSIDTYAEPPKGNPPATAPLSTKISYGYKIARNKKDTDGNTQKVYNDGGTVVDHQAPITEVTGTVTVGQLVTG